MARLGYFLGKKDILILAVLILVDLLLCRGMLIPFDPNVKFSDWVRSFGNTSPVFSYIPYNETQQTRFLQGTAAGFDPHSIGMPCPRL